jgi:hypothetical protein
MANDAPAAAPAFDSGLPIAGDGTSVIRAEIASNACTALGITARAEAPVLALCRLLVAAGHDPGQPLHAYRGDVLCLKVRSIGEGAQLECNQTGFSVRAARRAAA